MKYTITKNHGCKCNVNVEMEVPVNIDKRKKGMVLGCK